MKPYYDRNGITLYNANCVDALSENVADASIDLTVTSPPYDQMDAEYNLIPGGLRTYEGYQLNFANLARQLYRVTKPGGVVVWVVGDSVVDGSETITSAEQKIFFRKIGFNIHDTMIYEKNGGLPDNCRYYQIFEYMLVLSIGKPKTINLIEDRPNRFTERWGKGRTVRNKDGTMSPRDDWHGRPVGRRNNIWKFNTGYGYSAGEDIAYQHPAIFPEALARDHILSWSNAGDMVLDPMCGSGTVLKMARILGRKAIGIDVSAKYCALTVQRLAQEVLWQ